MWDIIKRLKFICKYPFHKFRDAIRYVKVSNELKILIQEIKTQYPNAVFFLQMANLGEVYVSCAYLKYLKSIEKDIIVFILEEQKYTKQLINIFPHISQTYFISHRANDLIRNDKSFAEKFKIQSLDIYEHEFNNNKPGSMVEAFRVLLNVQNKLPCNLTSSTEDDLSKVHSIFIKTSCKIEKTVILTPEARSFEYPLLNDEFWIVLADRIVENGYDVVFNSNKNFAKYSSVFLSIRETILLAKLCGNVIGARSGLLDVLAGETNVFIQAIYPKNNDVFRSRFEHLKRFKFPENITTIEKLQIFYSLNKIRDDGKIKEIILESQTKEDLIKDILYTLNTQS